MVKIVVELPKQKLLAKPKDPTNEGRKNRIYKFSPNLSKQREGRPAVQPLS